METYRKPWELKGIIPRPLVLWLLNVKLLVLLVRAPKLDTPEWYNRAGLYSDKSIETLLFHIVQYHF